MNENRIDKIMNLITNEAPPVVPLESKNRRKQQMTFIAAAVVCFMLLVPIGGQTFAGTVIEWVKETLIETDTRFIKAVDEKVIDEIDSHITINYESADEMLNEMKDLSYVLPILPENFTFDSARIEIYGEEPYTSTAYMMKYVDQSSELDVPPSFFLQVNISKHEIFEESDDVTYGVIVSGEGLMSTSIVFLDEEAIFLNHGKSYSLGAPHIQLDATEYMMYDISCSISYQNIEGEELWKHGQTMLEEIYLQYK